MRIAEAVTRWRYRGVETKPKPRFETKSFVPRFGFPASLAGFNDVVDHGDAGKR